MSELSDSWAVPLQGLNKKCPKYEIMVAGCSRDCKICNGRKSSKISNQNKKSSKITLKSAILMILKKSPKLSAKQIKSRINKKYPDLQAKETTISLYLYKIKKEKT